LFWLSDEQRKRIEPFLPMDVREVERMDGRRVISGIGQMLKSGLFGRNAMAMKDRNLIAAGVLAVIAAVCCTAPLLVPAVGAVGLTAWLARAGNVLIPALIFCAGLIGFALYRKQRRER
jgi:mercuric ion transport protein